MTPFPASDMVPLKCERCGFDGSYLREMGHQCRVFVLLDEYEMLKRDAKRYLWLYNGDVDGLVIMKMHVEDVEDIAALVDGEPLDKLVDAAIASIPNTTTRTTTDK